MPYTPLQIREAFHLCFLQEFLRKFDPKLVILKGGVNLRFFFKSPRYSEDMDLDVKTASITSVQKNVLRTLQVLKSTLRTYGVREIIPPSMQTAKQTETTQRFKIHLIMEDGLDLFTKIEFSRRGTHGATLFERVNEGILRTYRLASVIVQHFDAVSASLQKIQALAARSEVQARDVFDLYHLRTFLPANYRLEVDARMSDEAVKCIASISFETYQDAVVSYLSAEDRDLLGHREIWEEMKEIMIQSLIEGENHD